MSLLERLHGVVKALGGVGEASVGLVADLISAPFVEDESDGIVETIFDSTVRNGTQFLSSTVGPQGLGGQAIGSLPSAVRDPGRAVLGPLFTGLEGIYREGIAEPISTAFTVGSIADSPSGGGIPGLFTPSNWSKAYRIAQHRSPGQALALFGTRDILDEAEVAKYAGTDTYKVISGISDALSRVVLDPTVIAGKGIKAGRTKFITQLLNSPEDVLAAVNSPRVARFTDDIWKIKSENPDTAAAVIRHRYFANHDAGSVISTIYGEAKSQDEIFEATRALMGDKEALAILRERRSLLHEPISSLNRQIDQLGPIKAMEPYKYKGTIADPGSSLFGVDPVGIPGDISALRSERDIYYRSDARLARIESAFGAIRQSPRERAIPFIPAIGEVRTAITRSDFYQHNPLGKTLSVIFHKVSHPVINISDARSDIHIHRLMKEADLPQDLADTFRTEYMRAPDASSRHNIAIAAEKASIAHIAENAGLSVDELAAIFDDISKARGEAVDMLNTRVFNEDGSSILHHEDEFGEWVDTVLPPGFTQDAVLLPLINMRELKAASSSIGRFRAQHPSTTLPKAFADRLTRIWKPAVLLRPAWPIRVVGDEQFRIIAKIGALSHLENLRTGIRDYTSDFISTRREVGIKNVTGRSNRDIRQKFGVREFSYKNLDMEGVFGTPEDVRTYWRQAVTSGDSWRATIGDTEEVLLRNMREAGANFKSVSPDHADYPALYNWSIDRLRTHPIASRILANEDTESVINWLQSTPEGTDILAANSIRAHNIRNWVDDITAEVDKFSAGNDELRALIASGSASHDDLTRLIADESARPIAHGEVLNQALNQGYTAGLVSNLTTRAFDKLGRLPTDTMSRNPFMGHMYRAEVKRQLDLLGDTKITSSLKAQIENNARQYALNETQILLYDLAEQSRFGEMLGFLSPFYNAWEEVITRWAGLAIENPPFVARARLIWRAPEKMGLITDENGNEVKSGETYSDDPLAPNFRGKDRYLTIPLPDFVKDIPGMKGLTSKDEIKFNKKSFNLVLQGWPSVGPLVQIPVNEIVKDRPELADSVKAILPFGPINTGSDIGDIVAQLMPSAAKLALSAAEEDERYSNSLMRIYLDKLTDYQTGKREDKPTFEEAKSEAKAFTWLRAALNWTLPATPSFQSPYQSYINTFRQAQARYAADKNSLVDDSGNARTPDEWFLDTHGSEYFALTQAVTRSLNGIPPTMDSYQKQKEYKSLIEEYPELGGLIIGSDGAGEFNQAVYRSQLASPLSPSSDKSQREIIPFDEASIDPERRLGWIEYRQVMDILEATRIQRGLPNLQVAAARDLAEAKSAVTEFLAAKYPAWFDDFNQTDKGKWDKRIEAFKVIASKPEMEGREDMRGIREYLEVRQVMTAELAKRKAAGGASTLTASSNADLADSWNAVTGFLVESNLPFSSVFYRYLENDPLGL